MSKFRHIPSEAVEVETRAGAFIVRRFGIIATPHVVYEAWEADAGHTTVRRDDAHGALGKVSTRPLPAWVDPVELPYGSERRIDAVREVQAELAEWAREAILAAYPDVLDRENATTSGADIYTSENVGGAVA